MEYRIPENLGCVLEFKLSPREEIFLSEMPTQTVRGAFGAVLKDKLCVNKSGDCLQCMIRHGCVYSNTFETPQRLIPTLYKGMDAPPRPYIVHVPLSRKAHYRVGEQLIFHLTLIGESMQWLQYYVYTILELGERGLGKSRGKFALESVREINPFLKSSRKLYDPVKQMLTGQPKGVGKAQVDKAAKNMKGDGYLVIDFDTPIRIKHNGNILNRIDFDPLLRHLVRRQAQLFYFFNGFELKLDFPGYFHLASEITKEKDDMIPVDQKRYSGKQHQIVRMGGPIGRMAFRNSDLDIFLTPLLVGQLYHVGKGATFGLGHYTISRRDEI